MSSENRKYELRARAERQRETRRRIVEATVGLHEEVGPARTTIAEIARRAGVQRLTVYNHFPDERDLFAACSAHWLAEHPPPDLGDVFALEDPWQRIGMALRRLYARYRETEPMTAKVQRDRALIPALDAQAAATIDSQLGDLSDALAGSLELSGAADSRARAAIRLALDFHTWDLLAKQGLTDRQAADLMMRSVRGATG
jgi:AcrR family transcriptional regulator